MSSIRLRAASPSGTIPSLSVRGLCDAASPCPYREGAGGDNVSTIAARVDKVLPWPRLDYRIFVLVCQASNWSLLLLSNDLAIFLTQKYINLATGLNQETFSANRRYRGTSGKATPNDTVLFLPRYSIISKIACLNQCPAWVDGAVLSVPFGKPFAEIQS